MKGKESEQNPIDQAIPEANPVTDTAPVETAPAETVPENAPDNSEAIAFIERFAPDADTSTPEGITAGLLTIVKMMVPVYDKLYDLANTDTQTAAFISDMLETGDVVKSLARNYDKEEMQAVLEEIDQDNYEEDKGKFSEKVTATKAHQELVKKNMEISFNDISEFMEEKKDWDEEKAQAFEDFVIKHYDDGKDGLITKADLALLEKAFKYDGDMAAKESQIAEAEENGKIIGKNEKIVAKNLSKEQAAKDYLPEGNAGIVKAPEPKRTPKDFGAKFMRDVKL
jgi:Ca2+-binding EF-hand superfamily protein